MADLGTGATFSLSVSAQSSCIRSITMPEMSIEDIESSCLTTTNFKTYLPADLSEPGEIQIEYLFDPTSDTLLARGADEIVTITWPIHTAGNTTNATFVADGYIKSIKLPDFGIDELQVATLTFKLNGADTEPAFTAEAA